MFQIESTTHQQKWPKSRWISHLYKFLPSIIIFILITGCGTTPHPVTPELSESKQAARTLLAEGRLQEAAKQYSYLASQTSPPFSHDYRLMAAEIYLDTQNPDIAKTLLAKIDFARLTSRQQARMHLITTRIALAEQNPEKALISLKKIYSQYCHDEEPNTLSRPPKPCASDLPKSFWIKFFRTQALAHLALGGEDYVLKAAHDRIVLDTLLTKTAEIEANHQATWQLLISLSPDLLLQNPSSSQTGILQGWLTLAGIVKQHVLNKASPHYETFLQALTSWQKQYPQHPARQFLLEKLLAITEDRPPSHIALLLPLDGVFAGAANAIRDGFLSAWFEDAKRPKIIIRNTIGTNIQLVYNQVINAGVDFVVGPLDKPSVTLLAELPGFPVPVLTLNHGRKSPVSSDQSTTGGLTLTRTHAPEPIIEKTATGSHLYQFTLSPESEAEQIAHRARHDGHIRAAILTPQTPWGQRMERAFATTWKQLDGTIIESRSFPAELKEISTTVQQLLQANNTVLQQSSPGLEHKSPPTMDHDGIDCIFMAAFPREARQLQPQIKFHHIGDEPIPVYATHHVFSGTVNTMLDEDLNGIIFGDMPWVLQRDLENEGTPRNTVTSIWPESVSKYLRFYAFGIDAYRIIPYLKRLRSQNFPNLMGETGELSIDTQGRVDRQLFWAVIDRGKPIPDKIGNQYNRYRKEMKWEM
uniref:LppC lipoprotein n=1 Tax=Candidatus Kentrum sp. FW TaxID=2126338 RepID=A0A450STU8_9GAMM|nr:MAG: hypothetical protein BECKFW1821A_GA0114235_107111 [Candidatus Kentron sp. FW]